MNLRTVRKLLGFIALPMLSALSPLLALPAITSRYGAEAWGTVAVAQSVGAACAVIVELGWGLNGPQRVARAMEKNRKQIFATALATKTVTFVTMGSIAAGIAVALTPTHPATAALVAVGTAGVGLSSAWYFIGTGSPSRIMTTDSLPRLAAVVFAAIAISAGWPLFVYGFALLLPSIFAPMISALLIGTTRGDFIAVRTAQRFRLAIRLQLTALSGRAVSALYIALPITLVSLVAPQAVVVFAAVERLQRMTLTVLQAVPNFMQAWVGTASDRPARFRRSRRAILINAALGSAAGCAFTLAAPLACRLLFSGVVELPLELAALGGCVIFTVCASRATGNIALVAAQNIRAISVSAVAGACVGVPAILALSAVLGSRGALLGELAAEITVLGVQLFAVYRSFRNES